MRGLSLSDKCVDLQVNLVTINAIWILHSCSVYFKDCSGHLVSTRSSKLQSIRQCIYLRVLSFNVQKYFLPLAMTSYTATKFFWLFLKMMKALLAAKKCNFSICSVFVVE